MEGLFCPEDRFLAFYANLLSCRVCPLRTLWKRVRGIRLFRVLILPCSSHSLFSFIAAVLLSWLNLFPGTRNRMFVPGKQYCHPRVPALWPQLRLPHVWLSPRVLGYCQQLLCFYQETLADSTAIQLCMLETHMCTSLPSSVALHLCCSHGVLSRLRACQPVWGLAWCWQWSTNPQAVPECRHIGTACSEPGVSTWADEMFPLHSLQPPRP